MATQTLARIDTSSMGAFPLDVPPTPSASTSKLMDMSKRLSLYQKSILIKERLARVRGFQEAFLDANAPYAAPTDANMPNDPVSIVCQCLRLGTSLCFLFNALRLSNKTLDLHPDAKPPNISACKKGAAHFLMAMKRELGWSDDDLFTITELYNPDTTGTVKVVDCVLKLLGELESRGLLMEEQPQDSADHMGQLDNRGKVVKEILDTERTYVASLEIIQDYKRILSESHTISRDEIFRIFINLDALVDFQRRFLIGVEAHASQPAELQRLGHLFVSMESAFSVYEPYCQNFSQANNLVEELKPRLEGCSDVFPASELHAQLIKPVQRVCKYPLLLEQLVKVTESSTTHFEELKQGWDAAKRVADRVNEALRRSENALAVVDLDQRVEDWKNHDVHSFGALLLKNRFFVVKNDSEREYHVYLFEKIVLCCKEVGPTKKKDKSNSMISAKRNSAKRKDLQLKGRIFINNVIEVQPRSANSLQVTWRGEGATENFTIKCKTEELLNLWHRTISKAVEDGQAARQRKSIGSKRSPQSQFPPTPLSELGTPATMSSLYEMRHGSMPSTSSAGYNVFDEEHGDYIDGLESRRRPTLSLPPGSRDQREHDNAARVRTADSSSAVIHQWRNETRSTGGSISGTSIPGVPSIPRGMSISSNASDTSNTNSLRSSSSSRGLRSKPSHDWGSAGFSPRSHEEEPGPPSSRIIARNGSLASLPHAIYAPPPTLRNRSASSPHVYQMPMVRHGSQDHAVPPLNVLQKGKGNMSSATLYSSASASTNDDARRFSQSSMDSDSHRSSGDSTQSQKSQPYSGMTSPESATSFGTMPFAGARSMPGEVGYIRLKVRYGKDAYVIAVLPGTNYIGLVDRITRKIALCGDQSAAASARIRLRYEDEEGDKVIIGSDEDLTLAFEGARYHPASGSPALTIYVD